MKTIIPDISIEAISSFLPKDILEMSFLDDSFGHKEVKSIIGTTGIERVRVAGKNQTSSDMCFEAANFLLEKENIDKQVINGLVFVSQTTDYILPATSIILQDRLGLSHGTICIDIHYGCSGYIYGLLQASMWINSGACEKVLVLAGDTTTKLINSKDKSLMMVFGDAGSATIVAKGDFPIGFTMNSDGSGFKDLIIPSGGFRNPKSDLSNELQTDDDNNSRTSENLYMDGMTIFNFAISNVHKDIDFLIDLMKWEKEDVKLYALHQANSFMLNYIRKKLNVESAKVPVNVKNYGNTGPASIPLLLSDILSNKNNYLDKVIMSGFGVGLSWGSVACNLVNTHFYEPINR